MSFLQFLLIMACLIGYHLVTYFGVQFIEGTPRWVGWKTDERIPFLPDFVFFYISWFPALVVIPWLIFYHSQDCFVRYAIAYALDMTVSCILFLCVPTTFQRPAPPEKGFGGFVLKIVYCSNHRFLNCAPSVHCSVSMLLGAFAMLCPGLPAVGKGAIVLWMALIVCSTLLVKQHVLLDMLTAIPTAIACTIGAYWIFAWLF